MEVLIDFQNQLPADYTDFLPDESMIQKWVAQACSAQKDTVELTVRLTDETEIQQLNQTYRHKDYATNVLSFPADLPEELNLPLLGDIVICAQVVNREAAEQHKTAEAHWAHMLVHGTLHLLGYDHIDEQDAEEMESREILILHQLGYDNPYILTEKQ